MENRCIALGASAGGLNPISRLFEGLKDASNNYYFLAQHFNPDSTSLLVQILSRYASHKIEFIGSRKKIEKGIFYILPPGKFLRLVDGFLWAEEEQERRGPTPSVDLFFETLAEYFKQDMLAVILSGSGSDGAKGVLHVLENGGEVFVQHPEEAKFSGMPESSLNASSQIKSLKCNHIINLLNADDYFKEKEKTIKESNLEKENQFSFSEIGEESLKKLITILYQNLEIDFSQYRIPSLQRRLGKYLNDHKLDSIDDFLQENSDNLEVLKELKNYLLIPVTSFFRDGNNFEALESLLKQKLSSLKKGDEFRVWIPACSTGQEAYSIALILQKLWEERNQSWSFKIFASDINQKNINFARKATYPIDDLAEIPHQFLDCIEVEEDQFFFKGEIRDKVIFSEQDILRHSAFHKMDLVCCRNLLIYLNLNAQSAVYKKFFHALKPDGILFLGKSESLRESDQYFYVINNQSKIFAKNPKAKSDNLTHFNGLKFDVSRFKVNLRDYEVKKKEEARSKNHIEIFRENLIEEILPPHVICSADWDVIEFHGDLNHFLIFPNGPRQSKLLFYLREQLHGEFVALSTRLKSGEKVVRSGFPLKLKVEADTFEVMIELRRYESDKNHDALNAIIFTKSLISESLEKDGDEVSTDFDSQLFYRIQLELDNTKKQLASIIEEAEGANEELQSMNEELQASNEELQSTNEELESTNEELLASNEELKNVNISLEEKNDEVLGMTNEVTAMFNHLSSMVIIFDSDLNLVRSNKAANMNFPALLDSVGRKFSSINLPNEILDFEEELKVAIQQNGEARHEVQVGSEHYLLRYSSFPHAGENYIILSLMVVTEIFTVKKKLERNELLNKAYFDNSNALIEIKSLDGCYEMVNQNFLNEFGFESGQVIGQFMEDLFPRKICDQVYQLESEAVRSLTRVTETLYLPTKEGGRYYLSSRFPIQYSRGGKINALGAISIDVTELVESNEKLKLAEEKGQQNTKLAALGELFASLGHELNNPLNAILVQANTLSKLIETGKSTEEKISKGIDRIDRLAMRASSIIKSIKMFGRETSLDEKVSVSFADIWTDVMTLIEHRIEENEIDLIVDVPSTLSVWCFPGDMGLVFVNLINNAIDALVESEQKEIIVGTKREGGKQIFFVADSGPGVGAEILDNLFIPFQTTKGIGKGSGLGLSLCFGIIRRHQGDIYLDKQASQTTFVVELPIKEEGDKS